MIQLVDLDTRDMERGIQEVLKSAETRSRAFFEGVKPVAKDELKQYKKDRRGPDGEAWPARSQATVERARRKGKQKRHKSRRGSMLGRVPTAYRWTAENDGLIGRHRVKWGAVHHEGGTVGHGAQIPARPFAGFSDSFSDEIREAWANWIQKDW